jgi:hypothetical protein
MQLIANSLTRINRNFFKCLDKYLGGVTMYIILKEVLCFLVFYDKVSGVRY